MDAKRIDILRKILKDSGNSMTTARLEICQALWGEEPLSIQQLTNKLKDKVDRASLYRNIELFEKLGIIHRIYIGWKYKIELSDVISHHHHHISCIKCGVVIAIHEEDKVEKLINLIAIKHNIQPTQHQLEIQGICTNCQK